MVSFYVQLIFGSIFLQNMIETVYKKDNQSQVIKQVTIGLLYKRNDKYK